ncbi:WXG100 family type VII secretion target [Streptomyces sp. NPDC003247]|uniref:WXG100 family type VII secretion target n=1 Tax=Streptomyces sp. NPDC003247 TaxID=3364677 RepID=UPI0036982AE7
MSEGIFIDHGKAMSSVQYLGQQTQEIAKVVNVLKANLQTVVEAWTGPEKDVYYGQVIPAWDSEIQNLNVYLLRLMEVLESNSITLRTTSLQNANNFSNI